MMNARVVSYAEPSNLEPEVHEAVDDAVEAGAEVQQPHFRENRHPGKIGGRSMVNVEIYCLKT